MGIIGIKDTPVQTLIHAAARRLNAPVTGAVLIVGMHYRMGALHMGG